MGDRLLRIAHLYPDLMNLYGDRGNVIALQRRCQWHGVGVEVVPVGMGDRPALIDFDIIFMGGGQDREQALICRDFEAVKGTSLAAAVEDGVAVLAVCGGFQLMGRHYLTRDGQRLPGLGILDAWTEAGQRRMIGNIVVESELDGQRRSIVGFENHSGRTYLGGGVRPLGRVVVGMGNNGEDGTEGLVHKHTIGTYLHGALLPKNPWLADWIIARALERRYGAAELRALDDALERRAHLAAVKRAEQTRGQLPRYP